MAEFVTPMDFLALKKSIHITYRLPDELMSIIKNQSQVNEWITNFTQFHGRNPNDSEVARYALCVFALFIQTPSSNELIQQKETD